MRRLKCFVMFSAGCLMLAVAGRTVVDTLSGPASATAGIVAQGYPIVAGADFNAVLAFDGTVWGGSVTDGADGQVVRWDRIPILDPPVPVDEILHWERDYLVTKAGVMWVRLDYEWIHTDGPPPLGPVSGSRNSLGSLKGVYKPAGQ